MCCGSAGIYNLVQPRAARELGERKARAILAAEPDVVATANPGCAVQLQAALRRLGRGDLRIAHPAELVAQAVSAARSGGRSQRLVWRGWKVCSTTPVSSLQRASRSISSRSRPEKARSAVSASTVRREKRRSIACWIRRRSGWNASATTSVVMVAATSFDWPVAETESEPRARSRPDRRLRGRR